MKTAPLPIWAEPRSGADGNKAGALSPPLTASVRQLPLLITKSQGTSECSACQSGSRDVGSAWATVFHCVNLLFDNGQGLAIERSLHGQ